MEVKEIDFKDIEILDIVEITTNVHALVAGIIIRKHISLDKGKIINLVSVLISDELYLDLVETDVDKIKWIGKYELKSLEV